MSRCVRCEKPNRNGNDVCDRCEEEMRESDYRAELERLNEIEPGPTGKGQP